ncbi:hypothetical protein DVU_3138 [Nitratidesulfovibrio vulgaris str. Hildenborough]|uniref:Uncharacterized protein n=1 Tax=Nitratidesulfovibrio vulgaris (strain ATCC 29579 / DSM 644 / CCUG 34227 / NCIMB 8303 / VKM B-1760 / Hildenborough) TaxID=882 RepID=Q726H0_NITV2|nr:hypothetical protein DVU_3138 [Nitratidesulfovibrio vulgaris str. Hildenborough]
MLVILCVHANMCLCLVRCVVLVLLGSIIAYSSRK